MRFLPYAPSLGPHIPSAGLVLALLWAGLVATPRRAICAPSVEAPLLKIRLETHLTSYASRPGSSFRAVVIADYERNGDILISRGSLIYGTVRRATSVGLGLRHERARLALQFREYQMPDGDRFPFAARLVSIDNAREAVLPDGQIRGVLAAQNPNGLLGGFWYNPGSDLFWFHSAIGLTGVSNQLLKAFSMGMPGGAALLAVRCAMFRFPEPEIHLPPGTDMNLAVTSVLSPAPELPGVAPTPLPERLAADLESLPREITRRNGRPVDDIVNIAFIGSRQLLTQAFTAAGWSTADPGSARSYSQAYIAFSSKHSYSTAPVSKLFYEGSPADLVFQKSFNTITKRDHIRIWHLGVLDGLEVWLGAATHDSGITFRTTALAFSHKIDGALDVERAKIIDDLSFAGCLAPAAYIERASASRLGMQGLVTTDGKLAVVSVEDCHSSLLAADAGSAPPPPGNKFTRITRRFILESRNYVLRENAYYWTYQLIRFHGLGGQ
jgi:LssY C-terminus